eukprot:Pgem_evm1s843
MVDGNLNKIFEHFDKPISYFIGKQSDMVFTDKALQLGLKFPEAILYQNQKFE